MPWIAITKMSRLFRHHGKQPMSEKSRVLIGLGEPGRLHYSKIVQIAMSLRDTTTDENELAVGYTVPQERLRRGRSSTWCYEPATNLIGDVFRHHRLLLPQG